MTTNISIAISAARGEARHRGFSPETMSFNDIAMVLDDMARQNRQAGVWYLSASDSEIKKLKREWSKWLKSVN